MPRWPARWTASAKLDIGPDPVVALAANAIVLQLWHVSSYSVDGIAFAAETLVGNGLGAQRWRGLGRPGRRLLNQMSGQRRKIIEPLA